ncbi:MAG TPA: TolC family protein [bacterium]|jgi:outer membrane protein TolC
MKDLRFAVAALLLTLLFAGGASALTLEQAIELGHQRSLQMQDPQIDRERIGGRIKEAWANALPDVSAQVAAQQYWRIPTVPVKFGGQTVLLQLNQKDNALASATLNQPLYTFGRVSSGLKAAYAARRSNAHLISSTDRSVSLDVMQRFWTVLLMREVVNARQTSLAVSDSALKRIQQMRAVGLMSDYDVLRAEVQAGNQIPALRQAENALHLSELSLKELLGVPMDTTLTVEGDLTGYTIPIAAEDSAKVLQRDDIEALRDLATMYRNLYIINRNSWMPILGGQIQYARQFAGSNWKMNSTNTPVSLYGGLALTIPIPSGKSLGLAQQAHADWEGAELTLSKAERGALLQFQNAVTSYQAANASESAAELAVQQAEQARRIAQTKLAQGQITTLEMNAAQLDELVARVSLAQAKYDRLVAAAQARVAAGLPPYAK